MLFSSRVSNFPSTLLERSQLIKLDIAVPRRNIARLQIASLNMVLFVIHSKHQLVIRLQILLVHILVLFHMEELEFTIVKLREVCFSSFSPRGDLK